MKVAVLAHSFPRFAGDTHGTFVKSLCEALAALGHEVHVLVPFDPELRDDPGSPLRIHSFRYVWPDRWHLLGYSRTLRRDVAMKLGAYLLSPLYFLFATRALSRLVRREGIELVHAHWHLPNGWIANRVRRRTGVPFAVTLHGSDVFMAERNGLFRSMARKALHGCAHVTSCSADLRERLLAIGSQGLDAGAAEALGEKLLLVANGTEVVSATEPPASATLDQKVPRQGDERLMVAIGRMVDKKGFRYLLDALPEVFERVGDDRLKLVLAGGGDLLDELKQQTAHLGLGQRVLFPGMLAHDEVLALLERAEVFAMPSVRDAKGNIDGLPIVVLEAMAAGVPVVATDLAGMPLAVDPGRTGMLVPEKDPAALAEGLVRVLADPEKGRAMGEAGRVKVAEELNWQAIARRHDLLYRQAVGNDPT